MNYYKITKDQTVVGVGSQFYRWHDKTNRYMCCDLGKGECVQDTLSEVYYHDAWLRTLPATAYPVENADVILISQEEYNELYEQLAGGEEIPFEPPAPEPEPEPERQDEDDHIMTVQEMRERIAELTALVMNGSKPFTATKSYMKNEMIADGSRIYRATRAIVRGETVTPGENCEETSIAEVLTALQAQA